jgi:hypothetical protein
LRNKKQISIDVDSVDNILEMSIDFCIFLEISIDVDKLLERSTV